MTLSLLQFTKFGCKRLTVMHAYLFGRQACKRSRSNFVNFVTKGNYSELPVKTSKERIWELDLLRGVAVILMVLFHIVFNLNFFFGVNWPNSTEGFWYYEGRLSAILFIGGAGMLTWVLALRDQKGWLRKMSRRAGKILFFGLLITVATGLFDANYTVYFGILHFMAVSVMMGAFLVRWPAFFLGLLAVAAFIFSPIVKNISGEGYLSLPLGVTPPYFQSFDYYPLLPWLGVFLLGIILGKIFYKKPVAMFKRPQWRVGRALEFCGRKSLLIYLVHQPLLIGLMMVLFRLTR